MASAKFAICIFQFSICNLPGLQDLTPWRDCRSKMLNPSLPPVSAAAWRFDLYPVARFGLNGVLAVEVSYLAVVNKPIAPAPPGLAARETIGTGFSPV